VGEEAEPVSTAPAGEWPEAVTAPLGRVDATVRRGDDVRVMSGPGIARRKVGHFFLGAPSTLSMCGWSCRPVDERARRSSGAAQIEDDGKARSRRARISLDTAHRRHGILTRNAGQSRDGLRAPDSPGRQTPRIIADIPEAPATNHLARQAELPKFMWFNTQSLSLCERTQITTPKQ